MELPHLNGTPCAKVDIEVKNLMKYTHIKHQKARHKGQHCLITATLPILDQVRASTFCRQNDDYCFQFPGQWFNLGIRPRHTYLDSVL